MGDNANRTIYAKDCLEVLTDSQAIPDKSVDLIYLDPPFNSNAKYNLPFKGQYLKDSKPVEAFLDTWQWGDFEDQALQDLRSTNHNTDGKGRIVADIVELTKRALAERPNAKISTAAYLVNMGVRLLAMRRVLKPTGSIYLHCDPTASHYLKMMMDAVFGARHFRNEIIWCYPPGGKGPKQGFHRKHDVVLFFSMEEATFSRPFRDLTPRQKAKFSSTDEDGRRYKEYRGTDRTYLDDVLGSPVPDWWIDIHSLGQTQSKERIGYPTQKPLSLLERIIQASSNPGDVVLDPFCGCGTTIEAAEILKRRWIGIDISQFAASLVRNRVVYSHRAHTGQLTRADIPIIGSPLSLSDAEALAKTPFDFERWACGEIGAEGMVHPPGQRGADGGIDGIIPFHTTAAFGENPESTFAVVQVKAGKVTPDNVKALYQTVDDAGAKCGVFVCFDKYMATVDNNRKKGMVKDMSGDFPIIQGFSVEDLIAGKRPRIPWAYPQAA